MAFGCAWLVGGEAQDRISGHSRRYVAILDDHQANLKGNSPKMSSQSSEITVCIRLGCRDPHWVVAQLLFLYTYNHDFQLNFVLDVRLCGARMFVGVASQSFHIILYLCI